MLDSFYKDGLDRGEKAADQDAMLATVETLIQSGAAAGYALTRLVGHHMDWLFFDKPATYNLVEYEGHDSTIFFPSATIR